MKCETDNTYNVAVATQLSMAVNDPSWFYDRHGVDFSKQTAYSVDIRITFVLFIRFPVWGIKCLEESFTEIGIC